MSRKIDCACGKALIVKDSYGGSAVRCPRCGQLVPLHDDEPEPIRVPGIHSGQTRSRRRGQSKPWYMPVGFTLGGVLAATALCVNVALRAVNRNNAAHEGQVINGELVNLGTAQIIGTVGIEIPNSGGRTVKIFVARPIDVDKYFPEVELPDDDEA